MMSLSSISIYKRKNSERLRNMISIYESELIAYLFWRGVRHHSLTIVQKSDGIWRFGLTLAVGVHQLAKRSRTLDLEVDLIAFLHIAVNTTLIRANGL
jgi:hypothetical protein